MTESTARSQRFATLAIVLVAAVVLSACGGKREASNEIPSGPHPIVVVAIDGLRFDRLGGHGAVGGGMPALDALARESVVFDWAFAQAPEGTASLASLLTGFYPGTHGVKRAGDALGAEARTLAESLSSAECDAAAFVDGEGVTADLGFAQGFNVFEARTGAGLRETASRAIAWMRGRQGKNFLLLVQGSDPARGAAAYDVAVAAVDAAIGDLVAAFRELRLDDRVTLVVLGTCGIDLGEHSAGDGPSIYAPVTRVPLMIRFPGAARAASVQEYVEVVDVGPTLLQVFGVAPPVTLHGKSLLPLIRGEAKPPYVAFGESPHRGGERFVALAGYRLIVGASGDRREVYHLADDPLESKDLVASEAKKAEVLAAHLAAWDKLVAATSLDPSQQAAPLDDTTLEKLKSLGYVQ